MFDNTTAVRKMKKKNALIEALSKAKAENNDWKVRQLEGKIAQFNQKNYPKIICRGNEGSYRKGKENT